MKLHKDKQGNMNDRASGHALSTHSHPPPPAAPAPPPHRRPAPLKNKTEPPRLYDTATYLGETLSASKRTTDSRNRHGDRGGGDGDAAAAFSAAAPRSGDVAADAGARGCANVATIAARAVRGGGGAATGAGAPWCGNAAGTAAAPRVGDAVAGADALEARDAVARAGRQGRGHAAASGNVPGGGDAAAGASGPGGDTEAVGGSPPGGGGGPLSLLEQTRFAAGCWTHIHS